VRLERDGVLTTLVGVPEQAAVIEAGVDLVDSGVQVSSYAGF